MKRLPRILLVAVLISLLLALPVNAAQASSQSDSIPNSATEAYVLEELRATGFADLQDFPEAERVIGGEFLANALKDPDVQSKPAIYIANATVAGDLWLSDRIIPYSISLMQMEFEGFVNFGGTQLQSFTAYNTNFHDSLSFIRSTFNGNVDIRDDVISESLNFYGAHISGELLLDGTQILGTVAMQGTSSPTEFWTATVEGVASFVGTHFAGEAYFAQSNFFRLEMAEAAFDQSVSFSGSSVERSAVFNNAKFNAQADFENFYVGNEALFSGATFNADVTFKNATAVREADFSDATFNGDATFDFFTAERFMDFVNTKFQNRFSLYYASVAWPYFANVTFNGPVTFEGMQASQDFELASTSYNYAEEPFPVSVAKVTGAVKFTDFAAHAGLLLSDSHFGSLSISTKDNPEIAAIDLTSTDIDSDLMMENVTMKGFIAEGASIGGSTTLKHVYITEALDLRNARIGFLKIDDQFDWPHDPAAFNLRGMTYTDIDLGDQGLTEETWQGLLLLVNQSAYSPQAYQALSQFLTDKGHPDWAAEVELAQKRRERNESLAPLSGAWLWSWFLDIFDGYGQRPALAFVWSGLVIAIGALVFRRKEDMLPVEQEDAQVEFNPIWYSFALFLPYIDLGIASKWEPNPSRKWARNYKYFHMILGWVLAPIALLTFGGIIG